jgi:hypothetical protein
VARGAPISAARAIPASHGAEYFVLKRCLGDMAPWVLNVRDEKGVAHKVELVDGEATTVRQLKRHVNGVRQPEERGVSDVRTS